MPEDLIPDHFPDRRGLWIVGNGLLVILDEFRLRPGAGAAVAKGDAFKGGPHIADGLG